MPPQITITALDEVDSTNTYGKRHFAALPDGALITAERQTAGRGRLGRSWFSRPGASFCGSLVMKSLIRPHHGTIVAGLAVLQTLRVFAPRAAFWLKWPNDVYLDNAKICGILAEGIASEGEIAGVVAGIGVNLNCTVAEMCKLDRPAASLNQVSGSEINSKKFISVLAENLNRYYIIGITRSDLLLTEWRAENRLIGQTVELVTANGTVRGRAVNVADDGALLLEDPAGSVHAYYAGDAGVAHSEGAARGTDAENNGDFSVNRKNK